MGGRASQWLVLNEVRGLFSLGIHNRNVTMETQRRMNENGFGRHRFRACTLSESQLFSPND